MIVEQPTAIGIVQPTPMTTSGKKYVPNPHLPPATRPNTFVPLVHHKKPTESRWKGTQHLTGQPRKRAQPLPTTVSSSSRAMKTPKAPATSSNLPTNATLPVMTSSNQQHAKVAPTAKLLCSKATESIESDCIVLKEAVSRELMIALAIPVTMTVIA